MVNPLYPFASHFIERNYCGHNYQMHYLDEGNGPILLMVHGNPTWSFFYREMVFGLRRYYRCIVPDHLGCGKSDHPRLDHYEYRLKDRINDLDFLINSIAPNKKINLVVHDWGGMIGMGLASRYPDKIESLIILNTAAFHLPRGKRLPFSLRLARNTALGAWLIRNKNLFCRLAVRWAVTKKKLDPAIREMYLSPYSRPDKREAVLRFVQGIPLVPEDPDYQQVSEIDNSLNLFAHVPMLICWGMKDFVFDEDFLDGWRQRFPFAEVITFPDSGHYLLEDSAPEVIDLVQKFLKLNLAKQVPA